MSLRYWGRHVSMERLRQLTAPDRGGTSAATLIAAARALGFTAKGVRLDVDQLDSLTPGSILHWDFNHFVVIDRVRDGGIDIVDPAAGPRRLTVEHLGRSFTGVAIALTPTKRLEGSRRPSGLWFGRYLGKVLAHRPMLVRIIVCALVLQSIALYMPLLMSVIVDRVVPDADRDLLGLLVLGSLAIVVFSLAATAVRGHLLVYLRNRFDADLTVEVQSRMLALSYSWFQSRSVGDLMMRLSSCGTIRETVTSSALSAIMDGALVLLYLILICAGSRTLVVLVLLLGTLRVAVFVLARRRQKELLSEELHKQAAAEGYQFQMMSGIEVLKACGAESEALERWRRLFIDRLKTNVNRGRVNVWVESAMSAISIGSPLAILLFGAREVLRGELTLGSMLGLNALAAGFLGPLSTLVSTALELQTVRGYMERIDDVLDSETEQERSDTVRSAPALRGAVSLENVSYRYSPHSAEILQDLTLEIRPGEFVAIVGSSGAGKSTLARLLVALYPPTCGRILYDGMDLNGMDMVSVRRQVGVVPQRTYLFGATIREMMTMIRPDATPEEVVEAAQAAAIHAEIEALPLGYDTALGDNGERVSGGQRQRIAIARALIGKPRILLLDEATSDLDGITERVIHANLQKLDCTRIVIAHRLASIRGADRIVVLHKGRVIGIGPHDTLVNDCEQYARFVMIQSVGAESLVNPGESQSPSPI